MFSFFLSALADKKSNRVVRSFFLSAKADKKNQAKNHFR